MTKRIPILLLVLALMPIVAFAQSYSAILSGAAEVPGPGDTDGTGIAVITIDGTTLHYSVWVQNIAAPTAAHVHAGGPGVAGDPVVTLNVNTLGNGSTTIDGTLANQIKANPSGYYVNVHNADFAAGAVRGQLTGSPSAEGNRVSYLPVIGTAPGANNTFFVTDLRIVNLGSSTASVTLDYYVQNAAGNASPTKSATVTVLPGAQKVLNDVVKNTLNGDNGIGGLRITATEDIVATARIVNDKRANGEGTAGFVMSSVEEGATSSLLPFLSNNVDYRTNLGYFNASSTPVTINFTVRRSSDGAVLGTAAVTAQPGAMLQQAVFTMISSVPVADRTQDDFYITWTASGPVHVYATVTDNITGDNVAVQ